MFSTCDPWAHCEHLVSGITMFSACTHQVLRPLPPVLGHILIGRLQAIFLSMQAASELRNSGVEMNVYSIESQPQRVVMQPIVPTTVLGQLTDHAEDLLMIQTW